MPVKKKRKLSAKQLNALAKGRASAKRKRKSKVTKKKVSIKKVISKPKTKKRKSPIMAKRRKSRKVRKAVTYARKAVRSIRRKSKSLGSHIKTGNIKEVLVNGGIIAVSAVVSSMILAKYVPLKDAKIKSAIPLAAGLALVSGKLVKNPMAKQVGFGLVVIGALSLVRAFKPELPLLAGEEDISALTYDNSMLGLPVDSSLGIPLQGEMDFVGPDTI